MQQINTPDGLFHDGAPSTGELGTIVSASWLNSVANELENVVTGLGGTLDPARDDQIKSLLTEKLAGKVNPATTLAGYGITDAAPKYNAVLTGTPVAPTAAVGTATDQLATTGFVARAILSAPQAPAGAVLSFAMASAPDGWLKCNGAAVSRTAYAKLFAAIGTLFGAGDGATTFNLPDLRGEFLRGWDDGRGADAGRALGSPQGDAIRNITGQTSHARSWGGAISGAFYQSGDLSAPSGSGSANGTTSTFDAARVVPTANENRPRNVALLLCIKY